MVDNKELEEAFFNEVDLCLEDHENFQHGLEDARTAFNETFEYHEPFDIAELLFNKGAHWRDKFCDELNIPTYPFWREAWQAALEYERERSKKLVEALERYADPNEYDRRECEKTWIAEEALKEYRGSND